MDNFSLGLCSTIRKMSNASRKEATALHRMSYEHTYFHEIFILCYGFNQKKFKHKTINYSRMMLMQRVSTRAASLMSMVALFCYDVYIERDLEAIYSNSNILFLHKDAEILFGSGFTFYGLRSFHV
jgi:hypothetical protein